MYKKLFYTFLVLTLSIFTACSSSEHRLVDKTIDIKSAEWARDSVKVIEFEIVDTSATYNLFYNVRNTIDYPYYNLYLNYKLIASNGDTLHTKTQQMDLFNDKTGEPYGNQGFFSGGSLGDVFDHIILAEQNISFKEAGTYQYALTHYMRTEESLEGLFSIGIKVTKNTTQ
ncbi:MAG: gliding motility lipoprotein GldH [Cyclobacteriaceae bacterium]